MNDFFSWNRFKLLIARDWSIHSKMMIITLGTIIGIFLFWNLIYPTNIYTLADRPTGFLWLLFFGGIFLTSNAFKELQNPQNRTNYFMLPASYFEKYISRWGLTSIGYALAVLLFYTFFYWSVNLASFLFSNHFPPFFNPFNWIFLKSMLIYSVIHAMFFLGAVYFRKNVMIKTLFALAIFGIILSVFSLILGRWVVFGVLTHDHLHDVLHSTLQGSTWKMIWGWRHIIHISFWAMVTFICWIVSYVRFKELEVL
jgi:hypothetical protein